MLTYSSEDRDLNQIAAALVQESIVLCEEKRDKVRRLHSLMAQRVACLEEFGKKARSLMGYEAE